MLRVDENDSKQVVNLLEGAVDPDGDVLFVAEVEVVGDARGLRWSGETLTVNPQDYQSLGTDESESVSFRYQITDGLESVERTIRIVIGGIDETPPSVADQYSVSANDRLVVDTTEGVLSNDGGAPDSVAVIESLPANGNLILNADGSFTYVPNRSFVGRDQFSYRPSNDEGLGEVASVVVVVNGVGGALGVVPQIEKEPDNSSARVNDDQEQVVQDGAGPTLVSFVLPEVERVNRYENRNAVATDQPSGVDESFEAQVTQFVPASQTVGIVYSDTKTSNTAAGPRGISVSGSETVVAEGTSANLDTSQSRGIRGLESSMQKLEQDLNASAASYTETVTISASGAATFTVGYVIWSLRSGTLLSTLLSSLPAWRYVDPIPVLQLLPPEDSDDASLEELLARANRSISTAE